jgi:hypothetical protein
MINQFIYEMQNNQVNQGYVKAHNKVQVVLSRDQAMEALTQWSCKEFGKSQEGSSNNAMLLKDFSTPFVCYGTLLTFGSMSRSSEGIMSGNRLQVLWWCWKVLHGLRV